MWPIISINIKRTQKTNKFVDTKNIFAYEYMASTSHKMVRSNSISNFTYVGCKKKNLDKQCYNLPLLAYIGSL